jgi:hypothetical protein
MRWTDPTPSCETAGRAMRSALFLGLLMATACAPQTIRVDLNGPRPRIDAPSFVGAGDRVRVVVSDSNWAHSYFSVMSTSDVGAVERSLVFGATELSKLGTLFHPTKESGSRDMMDPDEPGFVLSDQCLDGLSDSIAPMVKLLADSVNRLERPLLAARDSLNEIARAIRTPTGVALVTLLTDLPRRSLAVSLARDPLPAEASELLTRYTESRVRLADRREPVEAIILRALAYADRVGDLVALLPAGLDSAAAEELSPLLLRLDPLLMHYSGAVGSYRQSAAVRSRLRRRLGDRCVPELEPVAPTHPLQADPSIAALRNETAASALSVVNDLGSIARRTELLANVLNRLPGWVSSAEPQTVLDRGFAPNEVRIVVARQPRFGRFLATVTPSSNNLSQDEAEEKADESGRLIRVPELNEVTSDSVAVIRFDVYPRYRFHLGAGLVRSPLAVRHYLTAVDTVDGIAGVRIRETEKVPFQVFPAAFLSYNLYPFAGRIYDRRAEGWQGLGERLGIAAFAALSLQDPARDVVLGLSTEPFPGLQLGYGRHFSSVESPSFSPAGSRYAPGDFVPDAEGAALNRRWDAAWSALSLSVDANVFFTTIGALLK